MSGHVIGFVIIPSDAVYVFRATKDDNRPLGFRVDAERRPDHPIMRHFQRPEIPI
jgi:hypothetical protein